MARDLGREQYVLLTTFKKNGDAVPTPVWIAGLADGRLGFTTSTTTWKIKRIRNNPQVRLQPCNRTGEPTPGSSETAGTAEVFTSGPMVDRINSAVRAKYGWQLRLINLARRVTSRRRVGQGENDCVVVITRD